MIAQLNLFDDLSFYEGVDIEYKGARGGLPRDLWETYSAFANTEGGTIWLGVTQRSTELDIHGVPDPEKLVSDFWNAVNNRGKVSANLLVNEDVAILTFEEPDLKVVRINVPRADRRQRPVYLNNDPLRGTFRRNFEGDYRCTEQEVRRMFSDQSEEPADSTILEGFSLEDLDLESLRQYRNRFASNRPNSPWLSEDDMGLLSKLGGWRRDRASGREGLTLAGLLMFGRDETIRDPAAVPGYQLDYRERFSEDPAIRWTDRVTLDGTWAGNIFQFYQKVSLKLGSAPGVRRPFQTNEEGYRVSATAVAEALQEALVNALIHADYSGQGGIVIDCYFDRFEFSNPGTLLVSMEQLSRGGVSECRNKSLQLMFQMLGAGDKAGSGIDKIRTSWSAEHWQSPILKETLQPDRVVLELPMISTLPEEALQELGEAFGDRLSELSPDQLQAVVTAHVEGEVRNQRLQGMLTLHRVDITRMLRGLVKTGFLVSDGVGRGTSYQLAKEIEMQEAPPLGADTPPLTEEAPPLMEEAPPLSATSLPQEEIPQEDPRWELARPVRERQRVQRELMHKTILEVCSEDFLTLQQLGVLLGRSKLSRLQEEHLRPMIRNDELELRFPDTPNHPQQAYRTRRQGRPKEPA